MPSGNDISSTQEHSRDVPYSFFSAISGYGLEVTPGGQ